MIEKPLNKKAYGHICHLPNSKLGAGDHKLDDGMAELLTRATKNKNQTVIVSEKLDGSNVAIAKLGGVLMPLIRAGYRADNSHYLQHRLFALWVYKNQDRFQALLNDNERACGEWLLQTHGVPYNIMHEPFAIFDIIQGKHRRLTLEQMGERRSKAAFISPVCLHSGGAFSVEKMNAAYDTEYRLHHAHGFHGALERPEGAVWRIEEKKFVHGKCVHDEVLFLGKFVRSDSPTGIYLNKDDSKAVWNKYMGETITPAFLLNEKFETAEAFYTRRK